MAFILLLLFLLLCFLTRSGFSPSMLLEGNETKMLYWKALCTQDRVEYEKSLILKFKEMKSKLNFYFHGCNLKRYTAEHLDGFSYVLWLISLLQGTHSSLSQTHSCLSLLICGKDEEMLWLLCWEWMIKKKKIKELTVNIWLFLYISTALERILSVHRHYSVGDLYSTERLWIVNLCKKIKFNWIKLFMFTNSSDVLNCI